MSETFYKAGVAVREQHKTDTQTATGTTLVREWRRYIVVAIYSKIDVAQSCPDVAFPTAAALSGSPSVGTVLDRYHKFNPVTKELVTCEERVVEVVNGNVNDGWEQIGSHVVTEELD